MQENRTDLQIFLSKDGPRVDCGKPEGFFRKNPGRTGILGYWPLDRDLAVWIKLFRRSNLERRRWIGRPGTNHARGGDGARRSRAPAAEHCRRWPISVLPGLIRAGERLGGLSTARVTHLCQARGAGTLWAAGAVRAAALRAGLAGVRRAGY